MCTSKNDMRRSKCGQSNCSLATSLVCPALLVLVNSLLEGAIRVGGVRLSELLFLGIVSAKDGLRAGAVRL